ncbi:2,3-diaminopropionate biosynthesis protein SbnB (plasmid) [Deefgea piscis]|uniref:2,3-diaminopropionate biosynthesis protein SbnB n=1 Tax=Deefgea piscis TaxID=2739061 RepID=A0A6M8T2T2_9NEIS|nr:2,3-diaminopropionate biosynthesis protein SbnB [Deefgea piscis]QKJ68287.1 2,3-diaminopropionate biosynthesis protein SbnB [Deefgea piscis]
MFEFNIIPGAVIKKILAENPRQTLNSVEASYLAHHDGETVNPDSYFLRFPQNEKNRIIALPASIHSDVNVSGIKWISSFPDNIRQGIPRASAVLILNDQETGYPFACLEASLISAARTAASAVLGAFWLNKQHRKVESIAFIGAGIIARNILDMFFADDWQLQKVSVYDKDAASAQAFSNYAAEQSDAETGVAIDLSAALEADIVVFATNAGTPYVLEPMRFRPGQIVLNISLRDIAPELIVGAWNIFDDVDHCLKASTSPHLAEQLTGSRDFVTGTLAELIRGQISVDDSRPLVYSPFGMGILDLALGKAIYDEALEQNHAIAIPHFFEETNRW